MVSRVLKVAMVAGPEAGFGLPCIGRLVGMISPQVFLAFRFHQPSVYLYICDRLDTDQAN